MSNFDTLLIANRGEIAVRVIRAARELGIRSVAVFSDADEDSLHVRLADEAINIGPNQATKSYLNIPAILEAAKKSKAGAIHPGYGFLSENADFADAVEQAGMVFIGPSGKMINAMGDKANARKLAIQADVPVVPGSADVLNDLESATQEAKRIGYPILIKATAGGGGRGIRNCNNEADLAKQWPMAQAEAKAAFGNGACYLEHYVEYGRHIEVQILGDGDKAIHLYERECSLQRRRQKIWEEAPSPSITEDIREQMCQAAVRLAELVGFKGAGTVEFLYDENKHSFYFLEINTRIQVEHGITEMITGVDLVREMIKIAAGQPITLKQEDITCIGSSIEVRLNAEDPAKGFFPNVGTIESLIWPSGPGIRIDTMLYPGYTVPPYYDSMLAKLMVHAEDRPAALMRLKRALHELKIEGLTTTASLHEALVNDPDVQAGKYDTNFLERWLDDHGDLLKQQSKEAS